MTTTWSRRGILFLALAVFLTSLLYLQSTRYSTAPSAFADGDDKDAEIHTGFAERPTAAAATTTTSRALKEYVEELIVTSTTTTTLETLIEMRPTDEPEAPTPKAPSKGLVIGRLSRDEFGGGTDWVNELDDWTPYIYIVDLPPGANSSTGYRTKMNRAHEAMPYLTYIVEHYDALPDLTAFVHPHRGGRGAEASAWHTDVPHNDAVDMLRMLRVDYVLEQGYVNLRCVDKLPGCPDEIQPWRDPPDEERTAEHVFPYYYASMFNVTLSQVRERASVVAQACCAQFAVSKEQIRARPKSDYEHFVRFLEDTVLDGKQDETAGRVMEYMWHIIFGREHVFCPKAVECYCNLYGRFCRR